MKSKAKTQAGAAPRLYVHNVKTPFGEVQLAATERGVCRITLPGPHAGVSLHSEIAGSALRNHQVVTGGAENRKAAAQIKEYFNRKRTKFSFKIDLHAEGFKRKTLLDGVMKIPYGQTRSYGEVAAMVGNPRACRAVGNANATNPLPLVIPCHRVVAAHGLGGYGGGEALKKRLLELEGATY
ncbi:MAG TPA: methylated-DNA--[protein]-cysteine S-methyltransferase [candidate division Zixibacteria bacterium]|nr:methylated-DNA--[protein]-cysteine S-methyltransferase [candidate division Zixibacteria bacterium]